MKAILKKYSYYIILIFCFYSLEIILGDYHNGYGVLVFILVYIPLLVLILSIIYGVKKGFKWYLPIIVGLIWFPKVLTYGYDSGIEVYSLIYGIMAFIGMTIGSIFYFRRKRKKKV